MLKRIVLISFIGTVLFYSCKKDSPAYPAPPVQKTDTTPPFVLNVHIPNSAPHGIFTITTNDTAQETLKIFDRWGQLKLNQTLNGNTTFDIVGWQSGVYVYELITRTKTFKGYITFLY